MKISISFCQGIIVQDDLVEALQDGTIFAAGLDVMNPEPLTPKDHPLTQLPNCGKTRHFMNFIKNKTLTISISLVLTPHLGSAATKTRDNVSILSAQNLINGLEGRPMIYSLQ